MLTDELIESWKKKYGRIKKIAADNNEYYYRAVDLSEWLNLQSVLEQNKELKGEVEIVKIGLLYPDFQPKLGAGIILKISDDIMLMSGFGQDAVPQEV